MVAAWFLDRKFVLVVDSLYCGKSVLSTLPFEHGFDRSGSCQSGDVCASATGDKGTTRAESKKRRPAQEHRGLGEGPQLAGRRCILTSTVCGARCS